MVERIVMVGAASSVGAFFDPSSCFSPGGPGKALPQDFFARSSADVAADLVGKIIWRTGVGGGRLTEVEAYLPDGDPASHSFRGKTRRNTSMFGSPGCLYVYLSYGIHVLLNIVCEAPGIGSAVLIRSFEPLGDAAGLYANRIAHSGRRSPNEAPAFCLSGGREKLKWLSCGPGRVGQALGLDLELDGLPLGEPSGLWLLDDGTKARVVQARRVGIAKGEEMPLRFLDADSLFVS